MFLTPNKSTRQRGFTLIELVAVIIILSVLGIMTSSFIGTGVDIYTGIADRDKTINSVRFAMERLRREASNALPNSVAVSDNGQCLTFTPIVASSIYAVDFPIKPLSAKSGKIAAIKDYTFVAGDKAVVYILASDELAGNKSRSIKKINNSKDTLTFVNYGNFPLSSPARRVYIIQNNTTYFFKKYNDLYRIYRGSDCTDGVLMADNIKKGRFVVGDATLQRNGLVQVKFTLDSDGQEIPIEQTLHINNVP